MFLRMDFFSQLGVLGDFAAFFQPASRKRRFVLILLLLRANPQPPQIRFALRTC